jgi:hypothetical protein
VDLLVVLDFDGVLFNSAYEAFQVCECAANERPDLRRGIHFDEFMEFRSHVTDAWQFFRLYSKKDHLKDFSLLPDIVPGPEDFLFMDSFFSARKILMASPEWEKLMSPYPFFYQIKELINRQPEIFRILSTRNEYSIKRTLDFYSVPQIPIFGQEAIRGKGSKLAVATAEGWLRDDSYTVYLDDMNAHLEPFEGNVDLCIHAGWGYDTSGYESYTETQAFNMISGLVALASGKK